MLLFIITVFLYPYRTVFAVEWCVNTVDECTYNGDCASPHTCSCEGPRCSTTKPTSTPVPATATSIPRATLTTVPTIIPCVNITGCAGVCPGDCAPNACSATCNMTLHQCATTCTNTQDCPGNNYGAWGACSDGFQTRWCIDNPLNYQIQPCATDIPQSTPIPTSTTAPATCPARTGCSSVYFGFSYSYIPADYPVCSFLPPFPDSGGQTVPPPPVALMSFGDYRCDTGNCPGVCPNEVETGCSSSYPGYRWTFVPQNYPACQVGSFACGGQDWPLWLGQDDICSFSNTNGDEYVRDLTCGATVCPTAIPTVPILSCGAMSAGS